MTEPESRDSAESDASTAADRSGEAAAADAPAPEAPTPGAPGAPDTPSEPASPADPPRSDPAQGEATDDAPAADAAGPPGGDEPPVSKARQEPPEGPATVLFLALRRFEAFVLSWSIIAIAVLTVTNVFTRSLLGFSLSFVEEMCQFLIVLITFVGLGYAAGIGRHIRMTAIFDQLGDTSRRWVMVVISASTAALMFFLAYHGVRYVLTVQALGTRSPALSVPRWIIYSAAPLGLSLAGVQYALTNVRNLTASDVYLSYDTKDEYEDALGV